MKDNCILTAESVTEGHPDKLCDTIDVYKRQEQDH